MKSWLLEILGCPICHKSLEFEGISSNHLVRGFLRCFNGHSYRVKDGIPILKDRELSKNEFAWRVEFPNMEKYDKVQREYASYLSEKQREADGHLLDEMAKFVSRESLTLDVASGMGRLLLVLSRQLDKGKNLLGIDVDEKPLRGAMLKLEEEKSYSQVALCVMDGKHLALKPQKLPCVTSFFGLDNIPDTKTACQEISRVMKQKSPLIIATLWLEESSKSLALAEKLGFGAITTEDRLTQTLKETGFKIDSAEKFHTGRWPYNPMDRLPLEDDWYAHALVRAHKT